MRVSWFGVHFYCFLSTLFMAVREVLLSELLDNVLRPAAVVTEWREDKLYIKTPQGYSWLGYRDGLTAIASRTPLDRDGFRAHLRTYRPLFGETYGSLEEMDDEEVEYVIREVHKVRTDSAAERSQRGSES